MEQTELVEIVMGGEEQGWVYVEWMMVEMREPPGTVPSTEQREKEDEWEECATLMEAWIPVELEKRVAAAVEEVAAVPLLRDAIAEAIAVAVLLASSVTVDGRYDDKMGAGRTKMAVEMQRGLPTSGGVDE